MAKPDISALRIDPAARERRRTRWPLAVGAALIALVAAAAVWWLVAGGGAAEVRLATARAADSGPAAVLNASGYVTPRLRATLSAKVTAKVREVLVEEGVTVEAEQVLARLDDTDAQAELRAAEAEHAVATARLAEVEVDRADAERSLRRVEDLHRQGVASEDDLDRASTRALATGAGLELARRQATSAERRAAVARQAVDNHVVRAPFAGVVVSKDAQPGEMVSPVSAGGGFTRTGIATVVDMASLEVEVDVNEAYIARVRSGQRVEAVLDAYPEWRIPAHVITVIPTADRQKATVAVRIGFDALDPRILPDMGVKVAVLGDDAPKRPRVQGRGAESDESAARAHRADVEAIDGV